MSAFGPPTAGEPSKPRSPIPRPTEDSQRHKILVLGWRKAGKSSCIKTVFQNVPVKDVAYFGVTQRVEKIDYDSIVPLQIWDTPSSFELDQLDVPLGSFSTVVYVMDMQQDDTYHEAILRFVNVIMRAYLANPAMKFAVFIHKAEVLSEDYRGENYADIQRALSEELEDFPYPILQSLSPETDFSDPPTVSAIIEHLTGEIGFHMTSCHDVTLRDAWSKVIQDINEVLPPVEQLLLNFNATSGIDNSYLFDIASKVVVAAAGGRNDATLGLVTEYLSRFLQFRDLYKRLHREPDPPLNGKAENGEAEANGHAESVGDEDEDAQDLEPSGWWDEEDPSLPWMTQSTRLLPGTTISFWQFTPHLALVVLLRTETWQSNRGMVEYNLTFLRQGVRGILMEV